MSTAILQAVSPHELAAAKALFIEYRDVELADQYTIGGAGLNEELAEFPAPYVQPLGVIFLAQHESEFVGCVAVRPLSNRQGEVMRMYVKHSARGKGLAKQLLLRVMDWAKQAGYQELYLDSLHKFASAHALYKKLGFQLCPPYSADTTEAMKANMIFMKREL